jgi:hypothetical protein
MLQSMNLINQAFDSGHSSYRLYLQSLGDEAKTTGKFS